MNAKRLLPVLCIVMLVASACGTNSIPFQSTNTPTETNTPYPTNTQEPTAQPTLSPTPTPLVPGIDTPVSVEGVTFLFTCKEVIDGPVKAFGSNYTIIPIAGRVGLQIGGNFTGDALALFKGHLNKSKSLYIDDGSGNIPSGWIGFYPVDATTFKITFSVKKGSKSFILHNTVETPWTVDLTTLSTCVEQK